MDDSEALARLYLLSLGLGDVVYEPDGKVTPDFLVAGQIAVEVRRLNQNMTSESGIQGLEEIQIPLFESMKKLLRSLGPPKTGRSWFVTYHFKRPVAPKIELQQAVRNRLLAFQNGYFEASEIAISKNFCLRLFPASEVHPYSFILGGYTDLDSGGWVIHELEKNIQICVVEKSKKVSKLRSKYPEWWLILIDHINFGQKESLSIRRDWDWDKVILVNPLNPRIAYEI
jgi:hypothetical protein